MAHPEPVGEAEARGPALEIERLNRNFGALQVARNINLELQAGARHALIGPNGAGKTTFVNLVTGALEPTSGRIRLAGEDVTGLGEAARVKRGLARTFQINALFAPLTVLDAVCLATAERLGAGRAWLRPLARRADVVDAAIEVIERLELGPDALRPIRELAYGRQRLVEMAIALAQKPRVLLLDEPAAGVPSSEHRVILEVIESLGEELAVLIIEHDMDVVFRLARRITVLVAGAVLTEGTPAEIAADPEVRAVYLGEAAHG